MILLIFRLGDNMTKQQLLERFSEIDDYLLEQESDYQEEGATHDDMVWVYERVIEDLRSLLYKYLQE